MQSKPRLTILGVEKPTGFARLLVVPFFRPPLIRSRSIGLSIVYHAVPMECR